MSHPDSKETTASAQREASATEFGQLLVVATPIGNLGDISQRALETLRGADCILAEDTRHSKRLLNHYGINTRLRSCHEHNEADQLNWVANALREGKQIALISDAGTPLISDPGFVLVRGLREQGLPVVAIPGASSIIAALSVAGLPTDRFVFEGFLPAKSSARETVLKTFLEEPRTTIFLESSHRIKACAESLVNVFGNARKVVIARELTKRFETVLSGKATSVLETILQDEDQTRGEFVILLEGAVVEEDSSELQTNLRSILTVLVADLPVKQAATLAAKITGVRKNEAYTMAQDIKDCLND